MKISKSAYKAWKHESEAALKEQGRPVKILSRKWNTLKNILAILAILFILFLTLDLSTAGILPGNSNSTVGFKIVHELRLSPDFVADMDTNFPGARQWILAQLESYRPVVGVPE